ncbi:MAG: xanthine dehydrogenase family protein subunit M [Synergistaceae bacterium]|nr:xanthine dehydrogenase family protein subunit M [Synergistaceae bacterium]
MYLPDFEYYAPDSVAEACKMLTDFGARSKIFAGGTDLLPSMKHGLIAPEVLISLKNIADMKKIEYVQGKGIVIGGSSTHNDLVFSGVLEKKYRSVCSAAKSMAANQIRHLGTVGGNIVSSIPSADLPPILIALNSTVTLAGPKGKRSISLEEVFVNVRKTSIEPNEILTEVIIPDQAMTGSKYFKFALRKSGALATVGVAVAIQLEGKTLKDARIALGAVSPTPVRAPKAEKFLIGKEASEDVFEEAGKIASGECKPITDFRASAEYRADMVRVFTKRALGEAVNNGHI